MCFQVEEEVRQVDANSRALQALAEGLEGQLGANLAVLQENVQREVMGDVQKELQQALHQQRLLSASDIGTLRWATRSVVPSWLMASHIVIYVQPSPVENMEHQMVPFRDSSPTCGYYMFISLKRFSGLVWE